VNIVAKGSRNEVFKWFRNTLKQQKDERFLAMLIDSEDPVNDLEKTWEHLKRRDGWDKPDKASDEQVLFMTTCMETWIMADRETMQTHYGCCLQSTALLSQNNLEQRPHKEVINSLESASQNCSNTYSKGKRSFEILAKLKPEILIQYLPSFVRIYRILSEKLTSS